MKKIIKIVVLLLVVLGLGIVWVLYMPKASIQSSDAVSEMTAVDLYNAFESDEAEAEEKYLGKVVIVEGVVLERYEDENGAPVVILGDEEDNPVALVSFEASQKDDVEILGTGDNVKAKALCSGMLMEVVLNKGILLK